MNRLSALRGIAPAMGLFAALAVVAIWLRPLLPVDETRYLTVAWEMWASGDLLVPTLNGVAYAHKPPLLFWAIQASWALFGVSEAAARMVAPALSLIGFPFLFAIARRLYPASPALAPLAVLAFATLALMMVLGSMTMFDGPLTTFVLIGVYALVEARTAEQPRRRWAMIGLFTVALGGGLLTKGPVVFVHLLPIALSAPVWCPRRGTSVTTRWTMGRWYGAVAVAVLGGGALALAWAIPAALSGGEAFADQILWRQTAGRVVQAFAHRRPVWFYLVLLPVIVAPWGWALVAARRIHLREPGFRLALIWIVAPLVLLSLVSGKQIHYVVPELPAVALAAARILVDRETRVRWRLVIAGTGVAFVLGVLVVLGPLVVSHVPRARALALEVWTTPRLDLALAAAIAVLGGIGPLIWRWRRRSWTPWLVGVPMVAVFLAVHVYARIPMAERYDLSRLARQLEAGSGPLAMAPDYAGEFGFLGRILQPVDIVAMNRVRQWLDSHPDGRLVIRYARGRAPLEWAPIWVQPYRSRQIGIWAAPSETPVPSLATTFVTGADK
ncbi:MAG: phospholipid carrier-dependent glycosyltransferase [Alphaproteobacteria bacterium]|nr:MAG: phospholipid carrier-dependent glycosyltransferase [Alphaproteobacteria bacterium]